MRFSTFKIFTPLPCFSIIRIKPILNMKLINYKLNIFICIHTKYIFLYNSAYSDHNMRQHEGAFIGIMDNIGVSATFGKQLIHSHFAIRNKLF